MSPELVRLLVQATLDTLTMVALAATLGTLLGLPLGIFLATSRRGELLAAPWANAVLGFVVNATRSTPFIILVVAIIPFTRLIAGTSIGTLAATVPLTVAATPFIARLIEAAIREVDHGLVEAARAFGASPAQIIVKVLIPEALPGIVLGLTLAVVSLLGFSAMVGAVGGGWSAPIEVVRPLVWLLSLEDGQDGKAPEARRDCCQATAGGCADLTGPERGRCDPRARREFSDILPVAA